MAESQKQTSSSKEKGSLLDLDFGKDFLSSWKITEDPMDLEFAPVSKGKKKAFSFGKLDMDFNIDDFGKISSFNIDMPDLGISSPIKKGANTKDKSNKNPDPCSRNKNEKADKFAFSFDFNDLDGFDMKSSPRKEGIKSKRVEEKEKSSNRLGTQDHPAEDNGANGEHEDAISRMPISEALATLNPHTLVDAGSESCPSKSTQNDNILLNPEAKGDEVEPREVVPLLEKTTSTDKQRSNCLLDDSISLEPVPEGASVAIQVIEDVSIDSTSRSQDIVPELQEEVCSGATEHIVSSEKDNGMNQVGTGEGTECALDESIPNEKGNLTTPLEVSSKPLNSGLEQILSSPTGPEQALPSPVSLEQTPSLKPGRSTVNNLIPEKQREAFTTRLKYFKRLDKTEDLQSNASNQTKLLPPSDNVIGSRPSCLIDESGKGNIKEMQSDGKLIDVCLPNSGAPVSKEHLKAGSQEHDNDLMLNRPPDEGILKGTPASGRGSKNIKGLELVRLTRQTDKLTLQNSVNSANLLQNMPTLQTIKKSTSEGSKSHYSKFSRQIPALSSQKTSRSSGANLDSSKLIPQKARTLVQNSILVGQRQSKTAQVVGKMEQTPLNPSLKRKIIEIPNADAVLKPSKRLPEPPSNRKPVEISAGGGNREGSNNENVGYGNNRSILDNCQNDELDIPRDLSMKQLDIPFSLENDSNVEKAEACSNDLDDICNMLRKKHDEAKEILVRAIVNSNKLLMLNHPLYEEKIRLVQKFASQLTLKEVDTRT